MKFTANVADLQGAMGHVVTVFQNGMGIYNLDAKISTKGKNKLQVECSSNGAYFSEIIKDVEVLEEGSMTISVHYLSSLYLPAEKVTIDASKKQLNFSCGRLKGKLDGLSLNDEIEKIKDKSIKPAVYLDADLFSKLVDSILFRPTVSDGNAYLRFQASSDKGLFKVITADTFRAAIYKTKSIKSKKDFDKLFELVSAEEVVEKPSKKDDKGKAGKKETGKKAKEKAERKEAMEKLKTSVYIEENFDYVFPSSFLVSIKGMFEGRLELACDDKVIRMSDDRITLYHPSQTKDVGEKVISYMKALAEQKVKMEVEFVPNEANDIIVSACSIASAKEGRVHMSPDGDKVNIRVKADHAETKASFDAKVIKGKKDASLMLNSEYFIEFLGLVNAFTDDKIVMKVWDKAIALEASNATYIMPQLG